MEMLGYAALILRRVDSSFPTCSKLETSSERCILVDSLFEMFVCVYYLTKVNNFGDNLM